MGPSGPVTGFPLLRIIQERNKFEPDLSQARAFNKLNENVNR
jgi:hypothetical protein